MQHRVISLIPNTQLILHGGLDGWANKGANMKYKVGDKFIIEIECRSNINQGLYKIKGFNTLVFDEQGLDRLEQVHEHDGCDECEYEGESAYSFPCNACKQACIDRWTPKTEEIQVGDEVEHDDGQKAVVYKVGDTDIYAMYRGDNAVIRCNWFKGECHRTGKNYPEFIKALEQLPME